MTTAFRRICAGLLVATLALAACGGSEGSSSDRLSDEEFCAALVELEAEEGLDDAEALSRVVELADRAPDTELEAAFRQLTTMIDRLEGLDDDDADAFGEAMAIMFDPRMIAALERLDTYLRETCGIDPDGDPDETGSEASDMSAWDDLESTALHDTMRPIIAELAPESQGSGVSMFSRGRGVVVDLSVYEAGPFDAVALCEELARAVDAATTDPGVILEITADELVVAERLPGGACRDI